MHAEQLSLLSHNLPPLRLHQKVRLIAEGWEGEIVQMGPPYEAGDVVREWYAVGAWPPRGPLHALLPIYRRDELEALERDV